MPKFSIIMPTYNHAKFIGKAIRSVINQSLKDFELIIINNFSTDETLNIIKNFQDKRIKVINFNNFGVIASSRNQGIKLSKGRYIAFLDSDDVWSKNKLEISSRFLNKGYQFICHKMSKNQINKVTNNYSLKSISELTFENILLKGNVISTSSVVIKKNILEKTNFFCVSKKIVTAEDFHLWLKILSVGYKCHIIPMVLGYNREHNTNSSKNIFGSLKAAIRVLIKIKLNINNNFLKNNRNFRKSVAILYYSNGFKGLKTQNNFRFLTFLEKALKYERFNFKYNLVYIYYKIKWTLISFSS